jgi:hypothetical protein
MSRVEAITKGNRLVASSTDNLLDYTAALAVGREDVAGFGDILLDTAQIVHRALSEAFVQAPIEAGAKALFATIAERMVGRAAGAAAVAPAAAGPVQLSPFFPARAAGGLVWPSSPEAFVARSGRSGWRGWHARGERIRRQCSEHLRRVAPAARGGPRPDRRSDRGVWTGSRRPRPGSW